MLDVADQRKELGIARKAAKLAGGEDESVTKDEMEQFLYDVITGKEDSTEYDSASKFGVNIGVNVGF